MTKANWGERAYFFTVPNQNSLKEVRAGPQGSNLEAGADAEDMEGAT